MTPAQLHQAEQDRSLRAEHWEHRLPQLLAGTNRRPFWQFRAAGDMCDPTECAFISGRIERFDSAFWQAHNPAHCKRLECRCTIRAYAPSDLTPDLKHPLPREP